MADINKEMKIRISQTGAEETRAAIAGVGSAQENAGKSTGKWTGFIKEQRQENRQQNFVLRESSQAITTLAFATIALTNSSGDASKGTQQLTKSLLAGVGAFQGANFAIAGLGRAMGFAPGGVGMVISGVLGLGTAFYMFLDNSAEKAKRAAEQMKGFADVAKDFIEGVGKTEAQKELAGMQSRQDAARKLLEAAQGKKVSGRIIGASTFDEEAQQNEEKRLAVINREIQQLQSLITVNQNRIDAIQTYISVLEQAELVEKRKAGSQEEIDKKRKAFLESVPSFLDAQLAIEGQITNEIARRLQLQVQASMKGYAPVATGAKTELDIMLGRTQPEKLTAKGVKVDDYYKDAQRMMLDTIREQDRANVEQLRFIGLLDQSVGVMRQALNFLGVETDSFVGKLLSALDTILSIMKVIEGIKTIGSVISLMSGNPMGAVPMAVGGDVVGKVSGGTSITINAVDAHSFAKMLNAPDNRRAFVNAISNANRLGIN